MPYLILTTSLRNFRSLYRLSKRKSAKACWIFQINYIVAIISENDSIIGTAQGVTDFTSASNDFNASDETEIGTQCC